ncbi:MAG: hypothetical protein K8R35_05360 [Bacteroidales bacterium]|nr:hypothetical protein [Bacteroidales bacterium]
MAFDSLRLVTPCEYLDGKARWVAHGSADILDNALVYSGLKDALEGMDFVIASSARHRWLQQDIIKITQLNSVLDDKRESSGKTAIVFGREEYGLTNDEIKLCDLVVTIPMNREFPSLNLSQAVMIFAFELSKREMMSDISEPAEPADGSFRAIRQKVQSILDTTGISDNPVLAGRVIERLAHAADNDIKLIHSVSKTIIDKLQGTEKGDMK